jgi:hypothetical protein
LQDGRNVIVNKSRQIGCSWLSMAYAVWKTIFFADMSVLVLSAKERYAIELLKKAKFIFRKLPGFLRPSLLKDTQSEMAFEFSVIEDGTKFTADSNIVSLTTTGDSGRSFSASLVIIDEAAYIPNAEQVWASVLPTTTLGGQILILSTPNGISGDGSFFHRMVTQTDSGHNTGFDLVRAYYKDCGFDEEWLKKVTVGLTVQQVLQEYELTFVTAHSPYFDLMQLARCYKPPDEFPEVRRLMVKTDNHYTGVDASEGQGGDYHSITTLNDLGVQIFAYHTNTMSLSEFAGHMVDGEEDGKKWVEGIPTKVHREFPGVMVVERFGPGDVVYSSHILPQDVISKLVGKRSTYSSKSRALALLRIAFNENSIIITDAFTYACLQTFEDLSSGIVEKAGAAPGAYDDPVMSLCWAHNEYCKSHTLAVINVAGLSGQSSRMISLSGVDDLPRSALDTIISVGKITETAQAPQFDKGREFLWRLPTENERLTDGIDTGMRPPRVRTTPQIR